VRQGVFLDQIAELVPIHGVVDDLAQPRTHFRTVSVPNGLHEEIPQGFVTEKQFAEDVEDLSTQRLAFLLLMPSPAASVAMSTSLSLSCVKSDSFFFRSSRPMLP
jgi:hypothetical protein